MIPFFLFCGGIPLLVYLTILIAVNCRKYSPVVSGRSDLLLLALGLAGFVFAGPILFLVPINALLVWGNLVWPLLIILYFLLVFYLGSLLNPQIIIYNTNRDIVLKKIDQIVLDSGNNLIKTGEIFSIPEWDIHFRIENFSLFDNISLIPVVRSVRSAGWALFEQKLDSLFRQGPERGKGWKTALRLAALALLLTAALGALWIHYHDAIIESFLLLKCS
ncbi:MAG: hypothetical protein Q4G69_07810 [Planctomycetia bacterium]|nr:hypothetical protein [Planctomycetia bacterium]